MSNINTAKVSTTGLIDFLDFGNKVSWYKWMDASECNNSWAELTFLLPS